jgi:hypothetical protein
VLVAYLPFSRELVGDFGTGAYALNMTNLLTLWAVVSHASNRLSRNQPIFQGAPVNWAVP